MTLVRCQFNDSVARVSVGEKAHERKQIEVPCLRKRVLALRLSFKKGILLVSLDVSEKGSDV